MYVCTCASDHYKYPITRPNTHSCHFLIMKLVAITSFQATTTSFEIVAKLVDEDSPQYTVTNFSRSYYCRTTFSFLVTKDIAIFVSVEFKNGKQPIFTKLYNVTRIKNGANVYTWTYLPTGTKTVYVLRNEIKVGVFSFNLLYDKSM